jgi:hypothetical protein
MRRLLLIATGLSFASRSALSQTAGETAMQTLAISLGANWEMRRDDTASPLMYSGTGRGTQIDYTWERAGRSAYASLSAGALTLAPSRPVSDPQPEEAFSTYTVETGMRWRLPGGPGRTNELAFGAEFAASAIVTRHMYEDPNQSEQTFFLGDVTLGPTGRWRRRLGMGIVAATLTVPLLAWVQHPYADVRVANGLANLRYASPSQFRQAKGELSYIFRPEDRFGLTAVYSFGLLQIDDLQPVRSVSQSLSIAVVTRFGARP